MSEINKRIEALEAELQKLKKEIKPELEVGKWYKSSEECIYFKGEYRSYGINGNNEWVEYDTNIIGWDEYDFRLATNKEVEDALIKEAKRRGFKEGVLYNPVLLKKDIMRAGKDFTYSRWGDNTLDAGEGAGYIFKDGKWAEINDEVIKVGGYEVSNDGTYISIGCKTIHKGLIKDLDTLMKYSNFKKVAFDGVEVDIETIEKILNMK